MKLIEIKTCNLAWFSKSTCQKPKFPILTNEVKGSNLTTYCVIDAKSFKFSKKDTAKASFLAA